MEIGYMFVKHLLTVNNKSMSDEYLLKMNGNERFSYPNKMTRFVLLKTGL